MENTRSADLDLTLQVNGRARRLQLDSRVTLLDTLREHAASLLGTARRYSICTDDAHDAYQRAVEIFLKRAHRLDREGALPWLRTVVKHEALAVRAARQRLLGGGEVNLDARENREAATPEECAADADALTRSAEALQRLKPQEVRALLLKAQGHSYKEIGELTGWSYTNISCPIGPSTNLACATRRLTAPSP